MGNTSARYAQMRSTEIRRYGPAGHAGPFSTCHASRGGLQVPARLKRLSSRTTRTCHPVASGDALAAIFPRIRCRRASSAGARRSSIPDRYPDCLHFRAGRPVQGITSFRRNARTPVTRCATRDRVRHARTPDQSRFAFVGRRQGRRGALRLITSMAGAVALSVESSCPVANTTATGPATRAFVAHARFRSKFDVTAERSCKTCLAATRATRRRAHEKDHRRSGTLISRNGLGASTAHNFASGYSTAELMPAHKSVIHRRRRPRTVRDHRTLSTIAPVARHPW